MRDEKNARIREKFELSLDGRQIASIVVGALVILGVVFVLGLNVGRQIAARQAEAAHAGDLEALDRAPAGAAHVDEKTLTFHDRLTKDKPAAQPPVPEAKPAVVEPPREAPVAAAPAATPDTTPAVMPTAAEPETATPVATSTATPTKAAAPTQAATAKGTSKPATKTAAAPAAKAAAAPAAKTAAAPVKPATHPQEKFAVQLGASKSRADAERLAARFHAYHAHVVPGAGRWWRVRAGNFESREAAERFRKDVAKGTGASAVVVASR